LDDTIRRALSRGGIIDITTTGRRTGKPRRIEIYLHANHGRLHISGVPIAERKRAWLWNVEADPAITVHLKRGVEADLPATARVVSDEAGLTTTLIPGRGTERTSEMVAYSPLIESVTHTLLLVRWRAYEPHLTPLPIIHPP
jgi:deazaflavin-dependent oxidoreductase (nitroreductase family)